MTFGWSDTTVFCHRFSGPAVLASSGNSKLLKRSIPNDQNMSEEASLLILSKLSHSELRKSKGLLVYPGSHPISSYVNRGLAITSSGGN
jgi:hypothetical protein